MRACALPEWLYEDGIGEARAALVDDGVIIEAHIEPESDLPRLGAVLEMRLIERQGRRGIVRTLDKAHEGLIDPLDPAITLGATLRATVVREAIVEPGALKRMKLRVTPDASRCDGPGLRARIGASGMPVRTIGVYEADALEAAGWSEMLESAATGQVAFFGGMLRISLTPAMTLIDVDGDLEPFALARAGARAAAEAIVRFGLSGSIGIDLPTVGGKGERSAIADEVDAILPQPFERTAVNGFGFLQIVRPRLRASLCEVLTHEAPLAAARVLLRRAQRAGVIGAVTLSAAPAVAGALEAHPDWLARLARETGGRISLQADPGRAIWASDVAQTN